MRMRFEYSLLDGVVRGVGRGTSLGSAEEAMDVSPHFRPLQRGAAASADRVLVVSLRSCHDEDHGLGDRYGVVREPFVVAAEQRDVDRLLDAVRPVV